MRWLVKLLLRMSRSPIRAAGLESLLRFQVQLPANVHVGKGQILESLPCVCETWAEFLAPGQFCNEKVNKTVLSNQQDRKSPFLQDRKSPLSCWSRGQGGCLLPTGVYPLHQHPWCLAANDQTPLRWRQEPEGIHLEFYKERRRGQWEL